MNDLDKLVKYCDKQFTGKHLTLRFASKLFNRERFNALAMFYTWFRYCDDEIDQVQTREQAEAKFSQFQYYAMMISKGEEIPFSESPPFLAIQYLISRYQIPLYYFQAFFVGIELDIKNKTYQTLEDFTFYSYHIVDVLVAMSTYLLGVNNDKAVHYAMYYGVSNQLINTARDILIDAKLGRIYIPIEWLKETAIPQKDIANPIYRARLVKIAQRLINEAERFMSLGDQCLPYFSLRSACAISLARQMDSGIGKEILKKGIHAWDERIHLSLWKKLSLVPMAIARAIRAHRFQLWKKFKPIPALKIWDYQTQQANERECYEEYSKSSC